MKPILERRGRFSWWLSTPSTKDEGMGLEAGPFFTKIGALWHRTVWWTT